MILIVDFSLEAIIITRPPIGNVAIGFVCPMSTFAITGIFLSIFLENVRELTAVYLNLIPTSPRVSK